MGIEVAQHPAAAVIIDDRRQDSFGVHRPEEDDEF